MARNASRQYLHRKRNRNFAIVIWICPIWLRRKSATLLRNFSPARHLLIAEWKFRRYAAAKPRRWKLTGASKILELISFMFLIRLCTFFYFFYKGQEFFLAPFFPRRKPPHPVGGPSGAARGWTPAGGLKIRFALFRVFYARVNWISKLLARS